MMMRTGKQSPERRTIALGLLASSAYMGKRLQALGIAIASLHLPLVPWAPVLAIVACAPNGSGKDFATAVSRRIVLLPPIKERLQRLGVVLGKRWTQNKALEQAQEAVDDLDDSWQFAEHLLPQSTIDAAEHAEYEMMRVVLGGEVECDDDADDDDDNSNLAQPGNHHKRRRESTSMRASGSEIPLRCSVSDKVPIADATSLHHWMCSAGMNNCTKLTKTQLACFLARHGTHEDASTAAQKAVAWRQTRDLAGMPDEKLSQRVYLHGTRRRHVRLLVLHLGQAITVAGEYNTAAAVIARLEEAWDAMRADRKGALCGRVCIVADCIGLQMWHSGLAGLSGLFSYADMNFPLLLQGAELCKVNTVAIFAIPRLLRGSLPEGLQNAIKSHTSTWPPRLSSYGPRSQLPAAFGGSCTCLNCRNYMRWSKELEEQEPRGLANPNVRRRLRRKTVQILGFPFVWMLLLLRAIVLMPVYTIFAGGYSLLLRA